MQITWNLADLDARVWHDPNREQLVAGVRRRNELLLNIRAERGRPSGDSAEPGPPWMSEGTGYGFALAERGPSDRPATPLGFRA